MAEKMVRCPEGHFYDPSKHGACPWCALPADVGAGGEKTRPVRPVALPDAGPPGGAPPPPLPSPMAAAAAPPPMPSPAVAAPSAPPPMPAAGGPVTRRVGMMSTASNVVDPVVGWLVCLAGPDKGRDFRLHAEKNFIGRSPTMDVCIPGDDTVSREKHGVVIFDPKKQAFWLLPGDAAGLVYLNGEVVHSPAQMQRDDTIELGQTKLVLIPFCGDKYSWTPSAPPPSA